MILDDNDINNYNFGKDDPFQKCADNFIKMKKAAESQYATKNDIDQFNRLKQNLKPWLKKVEILFFQPEPQNRKSGNVCLEDGVVDNMFNTKIDYYLLIVDLGDNTQSRLLTKNTLLNEYYESEQKSGYRLIKYR